MPIITQIREKTSRWLESLEFHYGLESPPVNFTLHSEGHIHFGKCIFCSNNSNRVINMQRAKTGEGGAVSICDICRNRSIELLNNSNSINGLISLFTRFGELPKNALVYSDSGAKADKCVFCDSPVDSDHTNLGREILLPQNHVLTGSVACCQECLSIMIADNSNFNTKDIRIRDKCANCNSLYPVDYDLYRTRLNRGSLGRHCCNHCIIGYGVLDLGDDLLRIVDCKNCNIDVIIDHTLPENLDRADFPELCEYCAQYSYYDDDGTLISATRVDVDKWAGKIDGLQTGLYYKNPYLAVLRTVESRRRRNDTND